MRRPDELAEFEAKLGEEVESESQRAYLYACYEACIPRKFWNVSSEDVTHNVAAFQKYVAKYVARRRKVLKHGYSFLFSGDNGVGKTMFISYALTQFIKKGNSAYYTTLPQLDLDIKKGFHDKEAERRLENYLGSDFVAMDEVGKEHFESDSYLNTRLELLLKTRYDDGDPVLYGTNLDVEKLCEMYGPTLASIWEGRCLKVPLESGDFRKSIVTKLKKDLGL